LVKLFLDRIDFANEKYSTVVTPGLLQKMSKKCNRPGTFSVLVVFLGVFFENLQKIAKKSENVTVLL